MGSKTYADMRAWWPFSNEEVAPAMNEIPKAVFTTKGLDSLEKQTSSQAMKDANAALRLTYNQLPWQPGLLTLVQ